MTIHVMHLLNTDYTILSLNYTVPSLGSGTYDYLFRNACRYDLGSELASFHSRADHDLYFDLVNEYDGHPYGLKWMYCQIGLWNQSNSQASYSWMDGTPYDWGMRNATGAFPWDDSAWQKDVDCVLVNNRATKQDWSQYPCFGSYNVHCGACNTPTSRDYLFGMAGTMQFASQMENNKNFTIFIQINGTDLYNVGTNSIEWTTFTIAHNSSNDVERFNFEKLLSNSHNLGRITSMTIVFGSYGLNSNVTYNMSIGMCMQYTMY